MKNIEELKEQIDIVFNHEFNERKSGANTYSFVIKGGRPRYSGFNPLLEPETEKVHFESETVDALKKIYLSIENNPSLKDEYIYYLINKIENERPVSYLSISYDLTDLAFMTLIYLGSTDVAFKAFFNRSKKGLLILGYLRFLERFIHSHYIYLNEEQIKSLRTFFSESRFGSGFPTYTSNNILRMLDKILFDNLKLQLEGVNYEFNLDKKKVQDFVLKYGFDEKISKALDKIDEEFYRVSEDEFNFRNSISLLKEIFDNFTESLLDNLKQLTGKIPTKKHEKEHDTEMKHGFIGEHLEFTEGETRTMSALNKMLNEEKHSLISKKEKFRIVRNYTIEFLLLILIKFQKIKPTKS